MKAIEKAEICRFRLRIISECLDAHVGQPVSESVLMLALDDWGLSPNRAVLRADMNYLMLNRVATVLVNAGAPAAEWQLLNANPS